MYTDSCEVIWCFCVFLRACVKEQFSFCASTFLLCTCVVECNDSCMERGGLIGEKTEVVKKSYFLCIVLLNELTVV